MEPTTQQPILTPDDDGFPPWARGYVAVRPLDGDRWLVLMQLIPLPYSYNERTRIAIATPDAVGEHWCYTNGLAGILEFAAWPQPLTNWSRHMRADGTVEYPRSEALTLAQRVIDVQAGGRCCRVCGCTDNAACSPPCHWVEPDLCSACHGPMTMRGVDAFGTRRDDEVAQP